MKTLGIIPARYASSRFPGKPLVDIGGISMIERVYRQVEKASLVHKVVVATDDQKIFDHVKAFGGEVSMTRSDHRSGTDRCAEVASGLPEYRLVINVQGDEPFIDPEQVNAVVRPLMEREGTHISTLSKRLKSKEDVLNPNIVKVVMSPAGKGLYFSRSPIPYVRNHPVEEWMDHGVFYKHIGLYGFKRDVLLRLTGLEQSRYEKLESLEQLRWLEAGYSIFVGVTERETIGIDTPDDLKRVVRELKKG